MAPLQAAAAAQEVASRTAAAEMQQADSDVIHADRLSGLLAAVLRQIVPDWAHHASLAGLGGASSEPPQPWTPSPSINACAKYSESAGTYHTCNAVNSKHISSVEVAAGADEPWLQSSPLPSTVDECMATITALHAAGKLDLKAASAFCQTDRKSVV